MSNFGFCNNIYSWGYSSDGRVCYAEDLGSTLQHHINHKEVYNSESSTQRWMQEGQKFKACFSCIENSRSAWDTGDPVSFLK